MRSRRTVAVLLVTFLIAGFALGVAFYALAAPSLAVVDPLTQSALVALIAVVVAAVTAGAAIALGSQQSASESAAARADARDAREAERVDARAAREAERADAAAARESDRADGRAAHAAQIEEARSGRFADRIRERAADFRRGARDAVAAVLDDQARKRKGLSRRAYSRDPEFYAAGQELRLLVRLPATYERLDRLTKVIGDLETHTGEGDPADIGVFAAEMDALTQALEEFEDALRAELGAPPLPPGTRVRGTLGEPP